MRPQVPPALVAVAMLLSSPAVAQEQPSCAPAGAEICKLMSRPEFVSAYRKAYEEKLQPVDAVEDIRFNLRQVVTGSGHAGPAAIGKQLDVALDGALAHMQRQMCKGAAGKATGSPPDATSAVAEGFAAAGRGLGVSLPSELLGGMTGSFVGSLQPRGSSCLCSAANFSAVRTACSRA